MKWIKYFENDENESKTFWKISNREYGRLVYNRLNQYDQFDDKWMSEKFLRFTDEEIHEIRKIFPVSIRRYENGCLVGETNQLVYRTTFALFLYLTKMDDEWFYVSISYEKYGFESTYKCDQFDGLIDCLKLIKNKIEYQKYALDE